MSCHICIMALCRSEVFPNIGNGAVKPISPLIGKTSTAIQTDASQTLLKPDNGIFAHHSALWAKETPL